MKAVVDEARGGDQQEKLPVPKGFHFQRRLRARAQVPADPEIVESIKASCKNSIRDSVRSLGNNRCAHRLSPCSNFGVELSVALDRCGPFGGVHARQRQRTGTPGRMESQTYLCSLRNAEMVRLSKSYLLHRDGSLSATS